MRPTKFLLFLFLICQAQLSYAANCDSCNFEIKELQSPFPLTGQWLFSREDRPENKDIAFDASHWKTLKAPGNWNKVYGDGKNFRVGWYRAHLHFAPELLGQEVVILVDTYMASFQAFAQGQLIFERGGLRSGQKYFAAQAVPLRFRVTDELMVFTMRVDTINMVGVYQLPFQLETYRRDDLRISYWQMFSGDLRVFSAFLCFISGLLFLHYYLKTRYTMYFLSFLALFGFLYYYAGVTDMMQTIIPPEINLILNYPSLALGSLYLNIFASFFYKFNKRSAIIKQAYGWAMILALASFTWHFNLDWLQKGRKFAIAVSFFWVLQGCWMYWKAIRSPELNRKGLKTLLFSYIFLVLVGVHDALIAIGIINSVTLLFVGSFVVILAIIFVSSSILSDAFLENKRLVVALQASNETLETLVQERTKEIKVILDNVQHGFLLVDKNRRVAPNYSASCRAIFGNQEPGGQDFVDLLGFSGKARSLFICSFQQVYDNVLPHEVALDVLPKRFEVGDSVFSLSASVIEDKDGQVERLLFSMSNITRLEEMIQQDQKNRSLLKILAHRDAFWRFLDETRAGLRRSESYSIDLEQSKIRLELHTIKGNAMIFGLEELAKFIHILEDRPSISTQNLTEVSKSLEEFLSLNESFLGLDDSDRQHITIRSDEMHKLLKDLESKTLVQECRNELETFLINHRFKKALDLLGIIPEQMEVLARQLEKHVRIQIVGGHIRLDPDWASPLFAQLPHILRNAIDHGIESPEQRGQKPAQAELKIAFSEDYFAWKIEVSDDGRGIDPHKIEARARDLGFLREEEQNKLTEQQMIELIFHPGFTTRSEVTKISGRGFGMASLQASMEKIGASMTVESRIDQGTRFTIVIPKRILNRVA